MKNTTKEEQWNALKEYLKADIGDADSDEFVSALRDLYSLYTSNMTEWYARLYDPKVGGYYYSNSGRDNEEIVFKGEKYPLGPDLESTNQALNFLKSVGMIKDFKKDIPEVMQKEILNFVISCQHENGYFYNPQWPTELTESRPSRRSRDLNWSCDILFEKFGGVPNYDTPLGYKGKSPNKPEFKAEKNAAPRAANKNFENRESFLSYLASLDIANRSYHVGNELVAASPEILARDKELAAEGKDYRLMDILINWLNENQHPESGHWHNTSNYYGTNGLLKISGVYNYAKLPLPNAEVAAQSAIDAITSDEPMGAVVDLYNTWFTVGNIVENLRKCGGDEGVALADKIIRNLRRAAPPAIRKCKEKISVFQKPDGSFSYGPKYTSSTSQGMPVAFLDCAEGDINATGIASSGLTFYMMRALDLQDYKPHIFGKKEYERYLEIIEENRTNSKNA